MIWDLSSIKDIISIITNVFVIAFGLVAFFSFKYRFDENIRNLYYKNYLKFKEALTKFNGEEKITPEIEKLIDEAYEEARLYLSPKVCQIGSDIWCNKQNYLFSEWVLENKDSSAKMKKLAKKQLKNIPFDFSHQLDNLSFAYRENFVKDTSSLKGYFPSFVGCFNKVINLLEYHLSRDIYMYFRKENDQSG